MITASHWAGNSIKTSYHHAAKTALRVLVLTLRQRLLFYCKSRATADKNYALARAADLCKKRAGRGGGGTQGSVSGDKL